MILMVTLILVVVICAVVNQACVAVSVKDDAVFCVSEASSLLFALKEYEYFPTKFSGETVIVSPIFSVDVLNVILRAERTVICDDVTDAELVAYLSFTSSALT